MPNTNKQTTAATTPALIGAATVTSTGGFLSLAADGCPTLRIPVASADKASALLSRYRDRFGIGASDMKEGCGDIRADDGTLVARVSYNGRVWTPEGILLQEPVCQP
jgi:hypothetical protein